jgi:hypothetical protein
MTGLSLRNTIQAAQRRRHSGRHQRDPRLEPVICLRPPEEPVLKTPLSANRYVSATAGGSSCWQSR